MDSSNYTDGSVKPAYRSSVRGKQGRAGVKGSELHVHVHVAVMLRVARNSACRHEPASQLVCGRLMALRLKPFPKLPLIANLLAMHHCRECNCDYGPRPLGLSNIS